MEDELIRRVQKALDRAVVALLFPEIKNPRNSPVFYTQVYYRLKTIFTEDIPTQATDGRRLLINPHDFLKYPVNNQRYILAHECGHPLFRHIDLFPLHNLNVFPLHIEQRLHNMAGDYEINGVLDHAGYDVIEGDLLNHDFDGWTCLQIYKHLHEQFRTDPDFQLMTSGDIVYFEDDGSPESSREFIDLKAHITDVVGKAMAVAKMSGESIGSIPGTIRELHDAIVNPPLNFEVMLANYMSGYVRGDYTYRRPNRRYMPDLYLPTAYTERLANLAYFFDASGSVDDDQLNAYANALRIIQEILQPEKMTLGVFDTEIHSIQELDCTSDILHLELGGGGGTDVEPVMQWIQENKPEATLIFTDGDFYTPPTQPGSDIIWVINDDPEWQPPFGKAFYYETPRAI